MLKKRYETEDAIPEAARSFYTEDESGAWVLGVEGDDGKPAGGVDQRKYREMRDNNIALNKKLEELQGKVSALGDLDPETVKSAMANLAKTQNDEELQMIQAGKLDEVVSRRTQAMQANYQKQLEALETREKTAAEKGQKAFDRFASVFMAEQVGSALEKKKLRLRPTARQDLLMRASGTFAPTEELDALAPKGEAYGPDGKELSLDTWIDSLVDEAPHLFEGGAGGSAQGGGGGRRRIDPADLSPEEFTKAADEVNAGTAEWA